MMSFIFGHTGDGYCFHLTEVKGEPVCVWLPVIVHSKETGWHCFSSKHVCELQEGETYQGFFIAPMTDPKYPGKLVELKASGEAIGAIGYMPAPKSNLPAREGEPLVGYWVGKPYWNEGICTEALQLLLDYCINVMHFENIWADYFTGNPASGRVIQKCGFRNTGKLHRCNNLVGGDKDMVHIYKLEI